MNNNSIKNNSNLTFCYKRELDFWNHQIAIKSDDLFKRLDPSEKYHCPIYITDTMSKIESKYKKVRILKSPFDNTDKHGILRSTLGEFL